MNIRPPHARIATFEHLGRAILGASFGPEKWFTMMVSYFDESVADKIGFTYVCGWTATVGNWQSFEIDWRVFLAKFDVPYFHMKEFSQFTGPFKKWKDKEGTRRQFIQTAASIINDTVHQGFVCCTNCLLK